MSEKGINVFSRSCTIAKLKKLVALYGETTSTPTFSGLLRFLNIGTYEMQWIKTYADNKNEKYLAMLKLLDGFKLDLEAKMEEYLLYQGRHPDLKDAHNYNYNHLKWLLAVSNPRKYGGANYEIGGKPNEKAMKKLMPKNESEVCLLGNDKNS